MFDPYKGELNSAIPINVLYIPDEISFNYSVCWGYWSCTESTISGKAGMTRKATADPYSNWPIAIIKMLSGKCKI